jgi:hypothetical protein
VLKRGLLCCVCPMLNTSTIQCLSKEWQSRAVLHDPRSVLFVTCQPPICTNPTRELANGFLPRNDCLFPLNSRGQLRRFGARHTGPVCGENIGQRCGMPRITSSEDYPQISQDSSPRDADCFLTHFHSFEYINCSTAEVFFFSRFYQACTLWFSFLCSPRRIKPRRRGQGLLKELQVLLN